MAGAMASSTTSTSPSATSRRCRARSRSAGYHTGHVGRVAPRRRSVSRARIATGSITLPRWRGLGATTSISATSTTSAAPTLPRWLVADRGRDGPRHPLPRDDTWQERARTTRSPCSSPGARRTGRTRSTPTSTDGYDPCRRGPSWTTSHRRWPTSPGARSRTTTGVAPASTRRWARLLDALDRLELADDTHRLLLLGPRRSSLESRLRKADTTGWMHPTSCGHPRPPPTTSPPTSRS